MRLFTSDEHYGHARICELACRPFSHDASGLAQMNTELVMRHNAMAVAATETWHLGDFALGMHMAELYLPTVRLLTGNHILVAGNHDRFSAAYSDRLSYRTEWRERYYQAGFSCLFGDTDMADMSATVEIAGQPCDVSHFPYRGGGDSRDNERFTQFRLADRGGWLLCGHVHEKWRQKGRQINVGVDAWGGYPVTERQIATLIEAGPADLGPLQW